MNFLIGAVINIIVGILLSLLFRPSVGGGNQTGPRLGDLAVTSSAYGIPIFEHSGLVKTGGNIIWATPIVEVARTQTYNVSAGLLGDLFGLGQSYTTTTYEYFGNIAVSFGRASGNAHLLQLWLNDKLVYDVSVGSVTSTGTPTPSAISAISVADQGLKLRFYNGSETQAPDPLIVSDKGAAPAYRGQCYVVLERFPLKNYGNGIPQKIQAVLSFDANANAPFTELTELASADPPGSTSGSDAKSHMFLDPNSDELYMFKASATGISRSSVALMAMEVQAGAAATLDASSIHFGQSRLIYGQLGPNNFQHYSVLSADTLQQVGAFGVDATTGDINTPYNVPNPSFIGQYVYSNKLQGVEGAPFVVVSFASLLGDGGAAVYKGDTAPVFQGLDTSIDVGRGGPVMVYHQGGRCFVAQENDSVLNIHEPIITVFMDPNPLLVPPMVPNPVFTGFKLVKSLTKGGVDLAGTADLEGWCFVDEGQDSPSLIVSNGVSMCRINLDTGAVEATNLTLGFYSQDQWTNTGKLAFGDGKSSAGSDGKVFVIDTDSLTVAFTHSLSLSTFADSFTTNYKRAAYDPRSHTIILSRVNGQPVTDDRVVRILLERAVGNAVTLSSVVAGRFDRSGFAASDYDVSGLAGVSVRGYSVTQQVPERQIMEVMQAAYLFDIVESDFKVKARLRGPASVATIDSDFLGRPATDRTPAVEVREKHDLELPSKVEIHYLDIDRALEPGSVASPRVFSPNPTQNARSTQVLELPAVFSADEATQLSHRMIYTLWNQRRDLLSAIPPRYMALEPSDVVQAVIAGELKTLRFTKTDLGVDRVTEFEAHEEDSATYTSTVSGAAGTHDAAAVESGLPTRWHPLDIPLLSDLEDGQQVASRLHWAASGYDSTWPGMTLYMQELNSETYKEAGTEQLEAAWGVTTTAVPAATWTDSWDDPAHQFDVLVRRGLPRFQSAADDDEVFEGKNTLIVLADGGPELLQFRDVSVSGNTVTLSRLLRGRQGTEPLATSHPAGTKVVLLEPGRYGSHRLPLEALGIGIHYRPVTLHTNAVLSPDILFATTGQDLVPYSPVELASNFPGRSTDLTLSWVRRTRVGGSDFIDGAFDPSGEVSLGEQSEAYEVDYLYGGTVTIARTGLTSPSDTVALVAEWEATAIPEGGGNRVEAEVFLTSRGFDVAQGVAAPPTGWTAVVGTTTHVGGVVGTDHGTISPQAGSGFAAMLTPSEASAEIRQDASLAALGYDTEWIDLNNPTATLSVQCVAWRDAHNDLCRIVLEFRDGGGGLLGSQDSGNFTPAPKGSWEDHNVSGAVPTGTRTLRVRLIGTRAGVGIDAPEVGFDTVRLQLANGVPPLTAKVYQVSAIVGRGRAATIVA